MNKLLFCLCALFLLHCTEVPDYSTLKVSASPAKGGLIHKSPSGPEYEDGSIVTLVAEAAPGYVFAGWSGNVTVTDATKTTVIVNGNNMVIANFVETPITPDYVNVSARSNSIFIEWTPVSNATGYNIYRSTSPSGNYFSIGVSATNSYADYEIQLGTTYYYKVSSYNGRVEGSSTGFYSVTTQLSSPTGVTATASNTTSNITIQWSSVTSATGYRIYRNTSSSGNYTYIGTSSTTSYTDAGLSTGTTYYYKVSAQNSSVESSLSSYVSATTYSMNAPTNVYARADSEECSIVITWSSVPNATEYRISRSTSSSGTYQNLSYVYADELSYIDYDFDELSKDKTYYYKVEAYNEDTEEKRQSNSASTKFLCDYY